MRKKLLYALLLLVLGIIASLAAERLDVPADPSAGPEIARVVEVIDGDTIVVELDGRRETVRYIGIDTPELGYGEERDECFGTEARNRNTSLVGGKTVSIAKDMSERDRYGRLLRYVYESDTFVNAELVRGGYAHAATFPPDVAKSGEFRAFEREARESGVGFWSACPTAEEASPGNELLGGCGIKGNVSLSGERIYHVEGCDYYERTRIDESKGERWFCTEEEALATGWRKAENCPQ